jgi:hypothetical protein
MEPLKILQKHFDRVFREHDFVRGGLEALSPYGFTADNTLACVSLCRDEISSPLAASVREVWGESFNLSGLAGMFFVGRTGLSAAIHHAPRVDRRQRYVFYAVPHIAVGEGDSLGLCRRKGIRESNACGALCTFLAELKAGGPSLAMDQDDLEMSLLRLRLVKEIPHGRLPDLLELTRLTQKVIVADLERAIETVLDPETSDYAMLTGIQIHTGEGNFVQSLPGYVLVRGRREAVEI